MFHFRVFLHSFHPCLLESDKLGFKRPKHGCRLQRQPAEHISSACATTVAHELNIDRVIPEVAKIHHQFASRVMRAAPFYTPNGLSVRVAHLHRGSHLPVRQRDQQLLPKQSPRIRVSVSEDFCGNLDCGRMVMVIAAQQAVVPNENDAAAIPYD